MDNLDQLAVKIEALLERHERMKKEKELAHEQLREKQMESDQLKGQLSRFERERIEIRSRLEKILGQLERLHLR